MRNRVTLHIENFRSLRGRHDIELAPITLLIGENSAGKTALLAAACASLKNGFAQPHRLEGEPFLLPTKETQLSTDASSMSLGRTLAVGDGTVTSISAFSARSTFWAPTQIEIVAPEKFMLKLWRGNNSKGNVQFEARVLGVAGSKELKFSAPPPSLELQYVADMVLRRVLREMTEHPIAVRDLKLSSEVYVSAPYRMKPQRMYETRSMASSPSGEHIPQVLRTVLKARSRAGRASRMQLDDFGRSSGLFDSLSSTGIQTPAGEMFSILTNSTLGKQTLQDVGYGVSQVLPIVAEILLRPNCEYFMLQQPEVHLHPRSQVALASFLVNWASNNGKTIVVETHSDYIIDRVRADVSRGLIPPDDVLIYFMKLGPNGTEFHKISIDSEGNLLDLPDEYRAFFLQDQLTLMGLD